MVRLGVIKRWLGMWNGPDHIVSYYVLKETSAI